MKQAHHKRTQALTSASSSLAPLRESHGCCKGPRPGAPFLVLLQGHLDSTWLWSDFRICVLTRILLAEAKTALSSHAGAPKKSCAALM